jgi:PAS domain-containing protein
MTIKAPGADSTSIFGNVIFRLTWGLVLLNLAVVTLASLSLYQSRQNHEERAAVATRNLAELMAHDITASIRMIDLALYAIAIESQRQRVHGALSGQSLNVYIEQQLKKQPDLDGIRVADERGRLMHGTGVVTGSGLSIADRDYFMRLRNEPKAEMVFSKPVLGRISGKWVINLARPLRHQDGSFAGLVVGSVELASFIRKFSSVHLGPGGSLTLFDDDFRLVARQPEPLGVANSVGSNFGSPQLRDLFRTGQPAGTYKGRSIIDKVERVSTYRKIAGTPWNLVIGLATDDTLAAWRADVEKTIALVTAFMLITILSAGFINRAWKNQAAAVAALRVVNRTLDAEKHLNQTIIQSSPFAIYTRDSKGIVTAWNLAAEKLFGWRADEIVGKPLLTVPAGKERETEEIRQKVLNGEDLIQMEAPPWRHCGMRRA